MPVYTLHKYILLELPSATGINHTHGQRGDLTNFISNLI